MIWLGYTYLHSSDYKLWCPNENSWAGEALDKKVQSLLDNYLSSASSDAIKAFKEPASKYQKLRSGCSRLWYSFAQVFFIDFWLCVPFVFCLWCQQLRQSNRKPIMNHTPLCTRGIAGFCKRNSGFLWRGSREKAQTNWELQGFAFHEHLTMCMRLWILDVPTKGASLPEKCRWWFVHYDKHWVAKKSSGKRSQTCWGFCTRKRPSWEPMDWIPEHTPQSRLALRHIMPSCP